MYVACVAVMVTVALPVEAPEAMVVLKDLLNGLPAP